jgi:hypothetical protein
MEEKDNNPFESWMIFLEKFPLQIKTILKDFIN